MYKVILNSCKLMSTIKREPNYNEYKYFTSSSEIINPAKRIKLENQCKEELHIDWNENDNLYYDYNVNNFDDASVTLENANEASYSNSSVVIDESILKKNDNVTECPHCTYYTQNKCELRYHIRNMHLSTEDSLIPLECFKCGGKYKNINSKRTHLQYCGKEFTCAICFYKTKYKKMAIRHVVQFHIDGDGKSDQQKHLEASQMVNEIENRKSDEETVENDRYIHFCPNCGKLTSVRNRSKCSKCQIKFVYQCRKCSAEFQSLAGVKYHLAAKCDLKGYYHCPKCDFRSVDRFKVKVHMRKIHVGLNFNYDFKDIEWKLLEKDESVLPKCSKCGKTFGHAVHLNQHARFCRQLRETERLTNKDIIVNNLDAPDVTSEGPLKNFRKIVSRHCTTCNEDYEIDDCFSLLEQLCKKCSSMMKYKCKKCHEMRNSYGTMDYHLKSVCDPQLEFQCSKCDYKSTIFSLVNRHYSTLHTNHSTNCSKCAGQFKNWIYYKKHLCLCGKEAKLQCAHCPYKAKIKVHLKYHIFRIFKVISFLDICKHLDINCVNCQDKKKLGDHRKTCKQCQMKLQFKCKTCKKAFTDNYEFACEHVKVYLEAIKYECHQCGRGMVSKKSLQCHAKSCIANI